MPIYEYKCDKCGHVFEAMQRVGVFGSELHCPECNSVKVTKMISHISACGSSAKESGASNNSGCGFSSGGFG